MAKQTPTNPDWDWIQGVVERQQGALIRYAASLLGDLERGKDVAQDVFVKLCKQPRESVEPRLVPWLFRVARNRALDVLRKERRMKPFDEPDAASRLADGDSAPADRRRTEAIGDLAELVAALPERDRELVELKFQQGLSYKEIAEVTGLTVGNVGYLLHHAVKELKQRWQEAKAV